jgi:hypothetical protein
MSKRMPLRRLALLLGLLPVWAGAWGDLGHRLVGALAEEALRPATRERALALLAADPIDDGSHFADVANWADAVRGAHDPRYPDGWRWHWTRFADSTCRYDAAKQCKGGHCIVGAIERFRARLADRAQPAARRAEALRFLVHFVGDVHQPLHAGYRNDRNGFDVSVTWRGKEWSMHGVWDYALLASRKLDEPAYLRALQKNPLPLSGPLDPAAWAEASCRATRDDGVYAAPGELEAAWVASRRSMAERRVRLAASRLAAVVEAALGDPPGR